MIRLLAAVVSVAVAIGSQAALGYQFAPSCSCGGAYNLVANSVAQKYSAQMQQPQQRYPYPTAGVQTVSGVVVPQPGVERIGPATAIETPAPVMQNPAEFGTATYEEEPEGGQQVCADCGRSHVMTIPGRGADYRRQAGPPPPPPAPVRYYAPPESNSVVQQQQQQPQQYGGRYFVAQPATPLFASCPATVLYPAPSLLYTPVVAPARSSRFGPGPSGAPAAFGARPASALAATAASSTSDDSDDRLLKTFTIHSASDPVNLNSAAPAKPATAISPTGGPACSLPAKPPTTKK